MYIVANIVPNNNGLDNEKDYPRNMFKQLEDLEFADDVCLLSHKREHMEQKENKFNEESKKFGLEINIGKTKLMTVNNKKTASNKNRRPPNRKC
jgi:hypothetical protein